MSDESGGSDDQEKIPDDVGLLRRVAPNQEVKDEHGGWRPSSAVFKDPEMSVDSENMLHATGRNWQFTLRKHPNHGLVRLNAGHMRRLSQRIIHKPNPPKEPDNDVHSEIIGPKNPPSVWRKLSREMSAADKIQKPTRDRSRED